MAPRFVEVSRPVEDGVVWASTLPSTMSSTVRSLLPLNTSGMLFDSMYSSLPEIKAASDFQKAASDAFDRFPEARMETKYFLIYALAAAVLRWLFVLLRYRSILANYAATNAVNKEM